ncbi:hypothetical protein Tco_1153156 [Tanacetum coccineum]
MSSPTSNMVVDEASIYPWQALKPGRCTAGARTWRSSAEGGDSKMSGGGGKAKSHSTSSSAGKGIGASSRIDILAVCRLGDGTGV